MDVFDAMLYCRYGCVIMVSVFYFKLITYRKQLTSAASTVFR